MLTLLQLSDAAESCDANRAFVALVSASQGRIERVLGTQESKEELRAGIEARLLDGRIVAPSESRPPFLCTADGRVVWEAPPCALDARIRVLKSAEREEDVVRLLTPMEMSSRNGFRDILSLFEVLAEADFAWHWYILGRPGDDAVFESFIDGLERLGIEDCVTMVGEFSLEFYLKLAVNMDFALFPENPEGARQTLIEALQMGLPVICKANEMLKILTNGEERETLMLVRTWKQDAEEVLKTLRSIVGEPKTRRIEREFRNIRTWRELVEQLLSQAQC